jgi:glycerol-3-phosphate dehydrogenase
VDRNSFLQTIANRREAWDIAVIGGGATGAGIAVDAAARGFSVVLLEQSDFGKGTSSRSTKLVHGGVRYLQQGNIPLVMEALKERTLLLQNAPHLVRNLEFVVPNYQWWEAPFYGIGLKMYDLLAGKHGFGATKILSHDEVLKHLPTLEREGLRGGVVYHDGQFDDSRLLINLLQTAVEQGATILNYARVTALQKDESGRVNGLTFRDEESGRELLLAARCVINATGPFCDQIRKLDDDGTAPIIAPSQGVHIVLPPEFLPGGSAIMVPHTRDGRVMFAVPWHEHVVVGTTDTPVSEISLEPKPLPEEVDFILQTASRYLARHPTRADILSVFTGIRPLVKSSSDAGTAALSRDHAIQISRSGLLTIAGGKWTTYRKMAEDAVDRAMELASLPARDCVTKDLRVHGFLNGSDASGPLANYGTDGEKICGLIRERPELGKPLHAALPVCGAQIVWAARHEMARTLDDVLARRTRALFLNARAALAMAPAAAHLLAATLGRDENWEQGQLEDFRKIAAGFLPDSVAL